MTYPTRRRRPLGASVCRNQLLWALALFRGGRRQEAFNKLYQAMLENLYLVPFLLGRSPQRLDIWHGSNLAWIEYAVEVPQELLNLRDDVALQWAREVSEHPAVVERVARYVAIHRQLKREQAGPRRSALVDEAFALKKTATPACYLGVGELDTKRMSFFLRGVSNSWQSRNRKLDKPAAMRLPAVVRLSTHSRLSL